MKKEPSIDKKGRLSTRLWRYEVAWEDSYVELTTWTPIKTLLRNRRKLRTMQHSLGFILADDKRGIMLAGSVGGSHATSVICIPASAIRRRRRLQ